MDRLTAINVFIDIARSGSFTATAERLDMSRAMVTRYISTMESWLNVRLLQRTTRRVTLTEAGHRCLAQCLKLTEQTQALESETAHNDNELQGLLRVATSMSFGHAQLAKTICRFLAEHPKLKIDIDVSDRPVNLIEERIDLAIRIASNPDPSLIGRPLAVCESVLVASPHYLAKHGHPSTPEELRQHQCLGYRHFERNVWYLSYNNDYQAIDVECHLTANEATVLLEAAKNDGGIALQPTYLANEAIKQGQLDIVLPDWKPKDLTIYALYPSRQFLPPALRALIDYLVKDFASKPW
ncbi:LysR family transcriptional regulator [Zooshikella sp. RANM57]|uniref:LysR family transcriptional regulator n=1 Tax=Zooshikella sp. RANM57 TaxID=3425863 RepID=UPI003D6F43CA